MPVRPQDRTEDSEPQRGAKGTNNSAFVPLRLFVAIFAVSIIVKQRARLIQGEFKNRHKSRSRRRYEAEVFFVPISASLRRRLPFLNSPSASYPTSGTLPSCKTNTSPP